MDLNSLPDVSFAQKDIETILNDMILQYELAYYQQTGKQITLYPGDKVRIFLYSQALKEFQLRQLIDFSAKQNLLKYSTGDYLVNLGAFQNVEKLEADYATVTEQFNLSAPQSTIQTIPKGTRVGSESSNGIYFAASENITVPAGTSNITAVLECTKSGTVGNNFTPGQLNILVDPLPWIASVTNIDTSQGGADIEEEDSYRERIHEAPEGFSVAGPEGAYLFFAKKYNSNILDIKLNSPSPGTLDMRVLLKGGEIPTETFLQGLKEYLSDKSIRPLTDNLQVNAPDVVNYDINITYYILSNNSAEAATIQSSVNQAIQDYILWQKSKIGRDINPDELTTRIKSAGAKRAVITSPTYTAITGTKLAIASTNIAATYGGLEDD